MIYCPQCGKPNEENVQFCGECGAAIAAAAAAATQISAPQPVTAAFEIPESKIAYPMYKKIKGYAFYFIAVCFLYTLFSVVTIEGKGFESGRNMFSGGGGNGAKGTVNFSGFQLLFGKMPSFKVSEISNGKTHNEITNDVLNMQTGGRDEKLMRTPLFFRVSYYLLLVGMVLYAFGIWGPDKRKNYILGSLGKVIAFISAASIIWIFNDFENWAEKAKSLSSIVGENVTIDISSSGSLGLWGLVLAFGFLSVDYMIPNLQNIIAKAKNIEFKQIETA